MSQRKVVLYIAMSLDGYIAKKDDDLKFLDSVQVEGEDYGYHRFVEEVDTVIMGRKTYEKVLSFGIEFPHRGKKVYVLSRSKTGSDENVTFYGGDLSVLIAEEKKLPGRTIFLDGGADATQAFLKADLIDTLVISIIPHLLGSGIRLFEDGRPEQSLKLVACSSFSSGLVQVKYENVNR